MELDEFVTQSILRIQEAIKKSKDPQAGMKAGLPLMQGAKGGVEFDLGINITNEGKIEVIGQADEKYPVQSRLRFSIPILSL